MAQAETIAQALRDASAQLAGVGTTPRLDAERLMAHAMGLSRSEMLLHHMRGAMPEEFAGLLARRCAHEPMAYILGEEWFFDLPIGVSNDVLIPRADSEVLVECALASRPDARHVLDCGTGSGALLLAVLSRLPDAHGIGIDRSAAALDIARNNAARLEMADRVTMIRADWDDDGWTGELGAPFDLVLANPPYVEDDAGLEPSVSQYEPAGALFAGPDGLAAYRVLLPQLRGLLGTGGVALVEIGALQANAVSRLASDCGLAPAIFLDRAGRARVVRLAMAP